MAFPIPSWVSVNPKDFTQAASQGADAGIAAQRSQNSAQEDAARIGLQSQQLAQSALAESHRAAEAAKRLDHEQVMAQMEAQARREIAQKNAIRESQQLAIDAAYKQQRIGLGQQHVEQMQAVADAKARDAARMFANQQGFAKALASGVPVAEAMAQFPVAPSMARALSPGGGVKDYGDPETMDLGGGVKAAFRRNSPGLHIINPVKNAPEISVSNRIQVQKAIDGLERQKAGLIPGADDAQIRQIDARIQNWNQFGQTNTPAPSDDATGHPEGARVRNKKTGQYFRVRGGKLVPESQQASAPLAPPEVDATQEQDDDGE